jgi:hypothetical protein
MVIEAWARNHRLYCLRQRNCVCAPSYQAGLSMNNLFDDTSDRSSNNWDTRAQRSCRHTGLTGLDMGQNNRVKTRQMIPYFSIG